MEGAVKETPQTTTGLFATSAGPQDDFWNWGNTLADPVLEEEPLGKTENMPGDQHLTGGDEGFNTIRNYLKSGEIQEGTTEYFFFKRYFFSPDSLYKAYKSGRQENKNTDSLIGAGLSFAGLRKKIFEAENFSIAKFQKTIAPQGSKKFYGVEFAEEATIDKLLIDFKNRELYAATKVLKIDSLDYIGADYRVSTDEIVLANFKMHTYFDRKGLHNIKEENGVLSYKQKTNKAWKKKDENELLKGVIEIQGDLDLSNLRFFSKGEDKDSPTSAMGFGKIVAHGLNIHIEHDFGKKSTFGLAVGIFSPIFTEILPNTLYLLVTSFFRIIDHLTEKDTDKQPSLEDFNNLLKAYNYGDLNLSLSFNDLVIEDLIYLADKNEYFKEEKTLLTKDQEEEKQKTKHINKISLGQTKIGLTSGKIAWKEDNARFEKMQVAYFQRVRKEIEIIEQENQVKFPLADTETLLLGDPALLAKIDSRLKDDAAHQLWKKIINRRRYEGLQLSLDTELTELSGAAYLQNAINETINTPGQNGFSGEIGLGPLQSKKIHLESQLTSDAVKDTTLRLQGLILPSVVVNHIYYGSPDGSFVLGKKKVNQEGAAPGSTETDNRITLKNISADVDLKFSEEAGNAVPNLVDIHSLTIGQVETGTVDVSFDQNGKVSILVVPPLAIVSIYAHNVYLDLTKKGLDMVQPTEGTNQTDLGLGRFDLKQPFKYTEATPVDEKDPLAGLKTQIAASLDVFTAENLDVKFKAGGVIAYKAGRVDIQGDVDYADGAIKLDAGAGAAFSGIEVEQYPKKGSLSYKIEQATLQAKAAYAEGDTKAIVDTEAAFTSIEVEQDMENGLIHIKKLGLARIGIPELNFTAGGYTLHSVNEQNAVSGVTLQGTVKLGSEEAAEDTLVITSFGIEEIAIFGLQAADKTGQLKLALPGDKPASIKGIYLRNYEFPLSGNFWSGRKTLKSAAIGAAGLNIPRIKAGIKNTFSYDGSASTGAIQLNDNVKGLSLVIQNPKTGLNYGIFGELTACTAFQNPKNFFEASDLIIHLSDLSVDLTNPMFHRLHMESENMSFVTDIRIQGLAHYNEGVFSTLKPDTPSDSYIIKSDAPVELNNFEWMMLKEKEPEKETHVTWPGFDKVLEDIQNNYLKTEAVSTYVAMPLPPDPLIEKRAQKGVLGPDWQFKKVEKIPFATEPFAPKPFDTKPFDTKPHLDVAPDTTKNIPYLPILSIDYKKLTSTIYPADQLREKNYTTEDWILWNDYISLHQRFDSWLVYLSPVKLKEEVENARIKLKEKAKKVQDKKQISMALDAIKNVNGFIEINAFDDSFTIDLENGKFDINELLKNITQTFALYTLDQSELQRIFNNAEIKKLAENLSDVARAHEYLSFGKADELSFRLEDLFDEIAAGKTTSVTTLATMLFSLPEYFSFESREDDNYLCLYLLGTSWLLEENLLEVAPIKDYENGKVSISAIIQKNIKENAADLASPTPEENYLHLLKYGISNINETSIVDLARIINSHFGNQLLDDFITQSEEIIFLLKEWFKTLFVALIKREFSSITIDFGNIDLKPIEEYINYNLGNLFKDDKGIPKKKPEFHFNEKSQVVQEDQDLKRKEKYLQLMKDFRESYLLTKPDATSVAKRTLPSIPRTEKAGSTEENKAPESFKEAGIKITNITAGDNLQLNIEMNKPLPGFTYIHSDDAFKLSLDSLQLNPFDFLLTKQFIQVKSPKGLKGSGVKIAIKK